MKQKQTNAILNANGGLHSRRALKKVEDRLRNHGMKRPILVQFVLTGYQTIREYQSAIKAIAGAIRYYGNELEYFGCYENDAQKGYHAHLYLLIETDKQFPWTVLDVREGKWLDKFAKKRGMNPIHVAQPQSPIHSVDGQKQFFARPTPGPKLDDCLQRISYLYKNRSKDGVEARETYFNSEFAANAVKRSAKKRKLPDSPAASPAALQPNESEQHEARTTEAPEANSIGLPADQEGADSTSSPCMVGTGQRTGSSQEGRSDEANSASPQRHSGEGTTTHREGIEMTLTTAQKFVGMLYERCVDQGLDVDEVRRYLLEHGVVRTPGQVAYELQHVYEFHRYVDTHPAKSRMSVRDWDRAIDKGATLSYP
ncbi:hypothetical protein [Massilia luteola]|uniref:hypothetical protein n=1 Tax=Massilia luteola TaxID=3081751 RepID=UPI002ACBE070|nr:hypothetical protein [Massilia sp. Gc5]